MTKRDMVRRAVAGRETPAVPYHVVFLGPLRQKVSDHFGGGDLNRAVGNYLVWELPPAEIGRVDLPGGEWLDEWGVRWRSTGVNRGYVVGHPLRGAGLAGFKTPELLPTRRTAGLREACDRDGDLYLLAWCGAIFEQAHFLRGMEDLLVDMHEDPAFVHGLLDLCLQFNLDMVSLLASYPVDAIILSDDYGQQRGPIMSPAHWREFVRPRLKVLFAAIRAAGKRVALHSCGDVSLLIRDLVDIGLEILHPVQPESMDLRALKREFKGLCLYGGLSAQGLVRFGSPAQIREAVRRAKEDLARDGGFILAPTLDLTHDVPFENVLAFLEAAQEGGGHG
jgi:uroporphyrinogen decarboxylase